MHMQDITFSLPSMKIIYKMSSISFFLAIKGVWM